MRRHLAQQQADGHADRLRRIALVIPDFAPYLTPRTLQASVSRMLNGLTQALERHGFNSETRVDWRDPDVRPHPTPTPEETP